MAKRSKTPTFVVFAAGDAKREWRFRIVAANGEIVGQSEGYTREIDAERGVEDFLDSIDMLGDYYGIEDPNGGRTYKHV